jgi:hypothetical protein
LRECVVETEFTKFTKINNKKQRLIFSFYLVIMVLLSISTSSHSITQEQLSNLKVHMSSHIELLSNDPDYVDKITTFLKFKHTRVEVNCCVAAGFKLNPIMLKQLFKTVNRLNTVSSLLSIPNATIWFVPLPHKRKMPCGNDSPSAVHINGGFTYINSADIYVYRLEEFPKVMMHELIHNSMLHVHTWDQSLLDRLHKELHISPSVSLTPNEAIVEVWAEVFHTACICAEHGFKKQDFTRMIGIESAWAATRAKKLLCQYDRCPGTVSGADIVKSPMWEEETPCFSYIVIRGALLQFLDSFLKLYGISDSLKSIKKDKLPSAEQLTDFIIAAYDGANFENVSEVKSAALKSSLRMTWFGDL